MLSLFADVRPGEGVHTVLLAINVFVLLFAYYLLKVVREPLILQHPGDAEIKSYASGVMAILLVPAILGYSRLSERINRMRLIAATTAFFTVNLVLFYVAQQQGVAIGRAFFVWTGIFNMFVVSQFWSFANDLHTAEQGHRLFAIIAIGSCSGAIVGSQYAKKFFDSHHPANLMLVSAALLIIALATTFFVHQHSKGSPELRAIEAARAPLSPPGAFTMLARDPYLALIAVLTLIYNGVNSVGEYVLDRVMFVVAQNSAEQGQYIAHFRADFYSWVNLFALVLQLFAVSRIMKHTAVRGALFVMPLISLGCYGMMGAFASLISIVFWAKIAENSVDYSLQSTTRQALFLVTSREAKYKAKVLTDTFFVRAGDTFASLVVFIGAKMLNLPPVGFVLLNLGLICTWLVVAFFIARLHRERSKAISDPPDSTNLVPTSSAGEPA